MSTCIQSSLAAGRCKTDSNFLELQLKTGIIYSALDGKFLRKELALITGGFVGFLSFFFGWGGEGVILVFRLYFILSAVSDCVTFFSFCFHLFA